MRTLSPTLIAVILGAAMAGLGAPYDLAAQNIEINKTPAHQIHKQAAMAEAAAAAMDVPQLAPGTSLVLPREGKAPIVLARRSA